jgi:hypothetical protein
VLLGVLVLLLRMRAASRPLHSLRLYCGLHWTLLLLLLLQLGWQELQLPALLQGLLLLLLLLPLPLLPLLLLLVLLHFGRLGAVTVQA